MVGNKLQTGQEGPLPLCLPGRHLCGLSSSVCAQGEKFRLSSPQGGWRWGSLAENLAGHSSQFFLLFPGPWRPGRVSLCKF